MMRLLALLLAIVAVNAVDITRYDEHFTNWVNFKQTHGKSYKSVEEEAARFLVFVDNYKYIQEHNKQFEAGVHTFDLGVNQFADMKNDEFRALYNGYKQKPRYSVNVFQAPANSTIPASVDWRTKGYVTPVKDQKQCGSCWAFSATGSLEGQHFKKTGKLVSISEQNLVDCSQKFGNEGCNGGWMDSAFEYIQDNKGIDTEVSYPYEAKDRPCRFKTENVGADDDGFVDIKHNSEADLEAAIATIGPISVAIDASRMSFQFYKSGVYNEQRCSSSMLDHGVLAVGYDTTDKGEKYYIVKNSWAESWGDKGYILMSRGKNNQCGIATQSSYPKV
jgi:cathepsin L